MSYQLKKVRLLSYKLHAAFSPSAHFRPKKAPRAKFSRGGGRVYFGVNGRFLCLGGPSYGHWKTMRVVLKNFFDLTPLSPYPTYGSAWHILQRGFFKWRHSTNTNQADWGIPELDYIMPGLKQLEAISISLL